VFSPDTFSLPPQHTNLFARSFPIPGHFSPTPSSPSPAPRLNFVAEGLGPFPGDSHRSLSPSFFLVEWQFSLFPLPPLSKCWTSQSEWQTMTKEEQTPDPPLHARKENVPIPRILLYSFTRSSPGGLFRATPSEVPSPCFVVL